MVKIQIRRASTAPAIARNEMRKPLSDELAKALFELAGGDGPFHILTPAICDLCKDEEKEAFPYGSKDGKDF